MKDRQDLIWNIVFGIIAIWNIILTQFDETWVGSEGWRTLSLIWLVLLARMVVSCIVPDCECKKEKKK